MGHEHRALRAHLATAIVVALLGFAPWCVHRLIASLDLDIQRLPLLSVIFAGIGVGSGLTFFVVMRLLSTGRTKVQ